MHYKTPKHAMQAILEVLLRVLALHFVHMSLPLGCS